MRGQRCLQSGGERDFTPEEVKAALQIDCRIEQMPEEMTAHTAMKSKKDKSTHFQFTKGLLFEDSTVRLSTGQKGIGATGCRLTG